MRAGRVLALVLAGVASFAVMLGGLMAVEEAGDPHCVASDGRIFTAIGGTQSPLAVVQDGTGCRVPSLSLSAGDLDGVDWTIAGLPADITGGQDESVGQRREYKLPDTFRWRDGYYFMNSLVSAIAESLLWLYGLLALLSLAALCGLEWVRISEKQTVAGEEPQP